MVYIERIKKAFSILKNNLILFVPDLIFLAVTVVLSLIFLKITGLFDIAIKSIQDTKLVESYFRDIIKNMPQLIKIIISLIVLLIINFIVGVSIAATKYDMIRESVINKKFSLKKSVINGKSYYLPIFLLKISVFLLFVMPIIIIILLNFLLKNKIIVGVLIFLMVIYWILLIFAVFFRYPILFLKTKNIKEVLKLSYQYLKQNKKHTTITLLLILLVAIILNYIVNIVIYIPQLAKDIPNLFIVLSVIFYLIKSIFNIGISLWVSLFIFLNYLKD